jgi:hypothetical protein
MKLRTCSSPSHHTFIMSDDTGSKRKQPETNFIRAFWDNIRRDKKLKADLAAGPAPSAQMLSQENDQSTEQIVKAYLRRQRWIVC